MKGTRFIILILSVLMFTICSGLLFYKNVFLIETSSYSGKVDFEDLRYTDLQINATTAMLRLNLSTDSTQLENEIIHLKELMNIVTDINKNSPELKNSIQKIKMYFEKKILNLNTFLTDLKELKRALESLNPTYYELIQSKIKFAVDNRDFYREAIVHALLFVSMSNKDNEARLNEDKKILSQIIVFSKIPNPKIQKFSTFIDIILKRTIEVNQLTENFNQDFSINNELNIVSKYYKEAEISKTRDGNIYLSIIFGAIFIYLLSVFLIVRKLS